MRTTSFTRLLPLTLLAIGLVITGILASQRSSSARVDELKARELSARSVGLVADGAEDRVIRHAENISAIARLLSGVADVDEARARIAAAGAFDRGSVIRAIYTEIDGRAEPFVNGETIVSREMPSVAEGLSAIESGIWSDTLAFGHKSSVDGDVDVVIIVDREALAFEAINRSASAFSVRLIGLPGQDAEPTEVSSFEPFPGNVHRRPGGAAYLTRQTTFLNALVVIEVEAPAELLWEPGASGTPYIVVGGALLSLALAGASFLMVRSVGRAVLARDQADAARRAAAARFRASFTHAPIGVVELAGDGSIVAANPRFASQLGFAPDELEGTFMLDLVDGEDRPAASARLDEILEGGVESDQADRRYRTRNGAAVWVRESTSVLASEDGLRHVLIQAEDISDERRATAELHRKALFDDLTGLPNRANLIARLSRAIEGDERGPGELMAVMFVDLDEFKQVNDTLGHEAGDLLLIEVAERLRRACRSSDTVARLGGDEFVVVCEGLPDEQAAELTAQRFAEALRSSMFINDVEVPVSASIGLVVDSDAENPDAILRQADQAMYRAKTSGRNQLIRFDITHVEKKEPAEIPLEITRDELQMGLEDDQFRLHYQPIADCEDGRIVGLEALVRWQHPQHGLLHPPSFLSQAEDFKLIEDIDAWVLQEGLQALGRWSEQAPETAEWFLIFNLSPTNYNNRSFVTTFTGYLEATTVKPGRVILERTETWFMTQTPTAVVSTRELRSLGVRISLDHFGTGASSLSEVSTLEFDMLKIDRSFVRDATDRDNYVLGALKSMADALGLKTVVEGVETADEHRIVKKWGIELAQGFHFSRPLDEETLIRDHLLSEKTLLT